MESSLHVKNEISRSARVCAGLDAHAERLSIGAVIPADVKSVHEATGGKL